MKNELYRVFKEIHIADLTDSDKLELLKIFKSTKNSLLRNQIAFIFSDLKYNYAIPFIIKKINEKKLYGNNGSLVYALQELDTNNYFDSIIKIICEQDYEARLMAFEIFKKDVSSVSTNEKKAALKTLEKYRIKEEKNSDNKGENSSLHFIEQTKKILLKASKVNKKTYKKKQ